MEIEHVKPAGFPMADVVAYRHGRVQVVRAEGPSLTTPVALCMRERDRHEFLSMGCDPALDAMRTVAATDDVWVAMIGDDPVFVFGSVAVARHVRCVFGWGTDRSKRVMPAVTAFARDIWFPARWSEGMTRCEVRVPASCTDSIAWLTDSLGARIETGLRGHSVFGELYYQIAHVKEN